VTESASEHIVVGESRLPPALAVAVAAVLYATLPAKFVSGSSGAFQVAQFLLPALEVLLLVPLVLTAPRLHPGLKVIDRFWQRRAILGLVGLITLANIASIVLLVHFIITGHQLKTPEIAPAGWEPRFVDYLYLSYTNAAAFSPTDVMPLTQWSKLLMLGESAASLLTLLMVAARAVNILH
jgi:hypothetical protein